MEITLHEWCPGNLDRRFGGAEGSTQYHCASLLSLELQTEFLDFLK